MPIYEYQCTACGHKLEAIQKVTDQPLTRCPSCDANQLQKLVSAAGFQLKGGGWYATDYSSKDKNKSKKEGKEGKEGQDSGGKTTSTETKSDPAGSSGKTKE